MLIDLVPISGGFLLKVVYSHCAFGIVQLAKALTIPVEDEPVFTYLTSKWLELAF